MAAIVANTGSNNWNTNGAWVGGVQPTAADDVTLPSGAAVTIPASTTVACRSCTVASGATLVFGGGSSILDIGDGTAGLLNVALSISSGATITLTGVGTFNMKSTSSTQQTIATGGKTMPNFTFTGVGSSYLTSDAINTGTTAGLNLTNGILNLNGQSHNIGFFSITGSAARTLTFAGANITITQGGNATVWNAGTTTNLTFTPDTGSITMTGAGSILGLPVFSAGGLTYNSLIWSGAFGIAQISGGCTTASLSITAGAALTNEMRSANNVTVTGTLTLNGNSVTNRLCIRSQTIGTTRTWSAATLVTNGFVDFMDITAAGASSPWSNSGFGVQNVTNITGASPVTTYWVGGTGNSNDATKYASSSGGTANTQRAPLLQDTAIYDANSGSGTLTMNSLRTGSIDMSNTSLTGVAFNGGFSDRFYGGDFILSSNAPIAFGGFGDVVLFCGRGSHLLTTPGTTFDIHAYSINTTGTYTLGTDLTSLTGWSQTLATVTTNNYNVTVLTFTQNSGTLNMGSSLFTLTSAASGATIWTGSGTINAGTSTILSTNSSSSNQTFAGGGKTYNKVLCTPGTGLFTITGSNSFNGLNLASFGAKTVRFSAGTTQTMLSNDFLRGTSGNICTITSTTNGSAYTITSAVTLITDYISLRDSTGAGTGNPHYAGANSTNVSGNSNWNFTAPPNQDKFFAVL